MAALHGGMIENLSDVIADYEKGFDALIESVWSGTEVGAMSEEESQEWDSSFMRAGRTTKLAMPEAPRIPTVEMPGESRINSLPSRG